MDLTKSFWLKTVIRGGYQWRYKCYNSLDGGIFGDLIAVFHLLSLVCDKSIPTIYYIFLIEKSHINGRFLKNRLKVIAISAI